MELLTFFLILVFTLASMMMFPVIITLTKQNVEYKKELEHYEDLHKSLVRLQNEKSQLESELSKHVKDIDEETAKKYITPFDVVDAMLKGEFNEEDTTVRKE